MEFRLVDAKINDQQKLSKKSSLHPVDSLRVRFWYQGIKRATKLSTAYQIECYFEPLDEVTDGRMNIRIQATTISHEISTSFSFQ